ncbi:hypothetical protein HDU96_009939 [Phlyctochytrium bullatum]|nr:hypothetical protein HDU96_009939 [Phlyctochytrium bullatum]
MEGLIEQRLRQFSRLQEQVNTQPLTPARKAALKARKVTGSNFALGEKTLKTVTLTPSRKEALRARRVTGGENVMKNLEGVLGLAKEAGKNVEKEKKKPSVVSLVLQEMADAAPAAEKGGRNSPFKGKGTPRSSFAPKTPSRLRNIVLSEEAPKEEVVAVLQERPGSANKISKQNTVKAVEESREENSTPSRKSARKAAGLKSPAVLDNVKSPLAEKENDVAKPSSASNFSKPGTPASTKKPLVVFDEAAPTPPKADPIIGKRDRLMKSNSPSPIKVSKRARLLENAPSTVADKILTETCKAEGLKNWKKLRTGTSRTRRSGRRSNIGSPMKVADVKTSANFNFGGERRVAPSAKEARLFGQYGWLAWTFERVAKKLGMIN